jgi:hypothetical protein
MATAVLSVLRELADVALRTEEYTSTDLLSADARAFAQELINGAGSPSPRPTPEGAGVLAVAPAGRGGGA